MKKNHLAPLVCVLVLTIACSKKVEKPKITISDYTTQAITSKGVVEKIMNESDHKKMHEIAMAVETSRAVSCVAVSDECNLLGVILNKIVTASKTGMPSVEDNVEIYKMINQLDQENRVGHEKLAQMWGEYIKDQEKERENSK